MSRPKDEPSYEVGYGKPPKSGQFKKGVSGNPAGRPKGKPMKISDAFEKELARKIQLSTDRGLETMTMITVIAKQLIAKAAKGDTKAADLIMKLMNQSAPETSDDLSPLLDSMRALHAKHEASSDRAFEDPAPPSNHQGKDEDGSHGRA